MQVSGIMAYLCINLGFAPFALVSLPFQGFMVALCSAFVV